MAGILSERMVKALVAANVARQMQGKPPLKELSHVVVKQMAQEVHDQFLVQDAYRREVAARASARAFNEARKSH